MISRRQFLQWAAAFGAVAALPTSYGFAVEPRLRPQITRYDL